jgi:hypothetical protein
MTEPTEIVVTVRRQWNDWREVKYRLCDIEGLHWTKVSGGVNASRLGPLYVAMCGATA